MRRLRVQREWRVGVQAELGDMAPCFAGVDAAAAGQLGESRGSNVLRVDLEEAPQCLSGVTAAVAVSAE